MIRVLIVDDHQDFSLAISEMFNLEADISVIGTVNRGEDAIKLLKKQRADVILMDIRLGKKWMSGLDAAENILSHHPQTEIIVLTNSCDEAQAERALSMGVKGYLTKQIILTDWLKAIRTVYQGQTFYCSFVQRVQQQRQRPSMLRKKVSLTPTETQIIQLISRGMDMPQIAANLNHRLETIKIHRRNLMQKFGTFTDRTLVHEAVRSGVLRVD
jgi:DNA-binding NarL/FixJ family response regulator